ncbi:MAG: gidB [Paucimonas sp.]|nr:gidB [Paucimonas sp.]
MTGAALSAADHADLTAELRQGAQALAVDLSEAQLGKLIDYVALLVKWNSAYNLTALREPRQMLTHHLLDSLAVVKSFASARRVLDVGAGAGLPGIVLAIWAAEAQPQMRVELIDTVQKKTAFLTQVKAQLKLGNVEVHAGRVEHLDAGRFDVITSRAFASLEDFVSWSGHLLETGGRFIAMKGVMPEEEIAALPAGWKVSSTEKIDVPGLKAERHLIMIERG